MALQGMVGKLQINIFFFLNEISRSFYFVGGCALFTGDLNLAQAKNG